MRTLKGLCIFFVVSLSLFSGCGSSTGIVKLDDNLYITSKTDMMVGSGTKLKMSLYPGAVDFCQSMGKKMEVVSTQQSDMDENKSWAGAELQFRCK